MLLSRGTITPGRTNLTGDEHFGLAYIVLAVLAVVATVMATRVVDEKPEPMDLALGLTATVPAFD